MNFRLVLLIVGRIFILSAAAMMPSLLVSFIYGDGAHFYFIVTMVALFIFGATLTMFFKKDKRTMRPREGFVAVALCWIAISMFGAIPPFLSGAIPNYIDALFEMIAGFTTTGATILHSIEALPKSIIFWRAFAQWLGGMGVLILTLAILPAGERGVYNLVKAEATGPASERLVPRVRQSAMILYMIYISLTLIQTIMLLIGKMSLFDALVHAFTTAGTGGFSSRDLSLGAFNSGYIEYTIAVFMLLFSLNFGLYFAAVTREFTKIKKNTEIKVFLCIILISTGLITANLMYNSVYLTLSETVRHSFFHSISLSSSTAFHVGDYNQWPNFSRLVLMCLMIIGGCAGSTASGLKAIRVVMLFRSTAREVRRIVHPRAVSVVHINQEPVQEKTLTGVQNYFVLYILVIVAATLLVSLDNMGLETTFTSVLAMISNVGPGFGLVGPTSNYAAFSSMAKIVMSITMLIGRLEIFPILILVFPSAWKHA